MAIEAAVQDGAFVIEGASYFKDTKLATDDSVDADWQRKDLYLGPQVWSRGAGIFILSFYRDIVQYDRLELGLQEKFDRNVDP